MQKRALIALAFAMPALGTDMPPAIPDAPIEYTEISYEQETAPADPYIAPVEAPAMPGPVAAASSEPGGGKFKVVVLRIILIGIKIREYIRHIHKNTSAVSSAGIVQTDKWDSGITQLRDRFCQRDRGVIHSVKRLYFIAGKSIEVHRYLHIVNAFHSFFLLNGRASANNQG